MTFVLPALMVLVVMAVLLKLLGLVVGRRGGASIGYVSRVTLLSIAEQRFCEALRGAVGDEFWICAKVRLADVILVPKGEGSQAAMNRVTSKHLDFVLIEPRSSRIRLAIELDDRSHRADSRKERDRFVDEALRSAGIPIVRFRAAAAYDVGEIREGVVSALSGLASVAQGGRSAA